MASDFEVAKFIWTILLLPLGWIAWIVKTLFSRQRETEKELAAHKLYAANNFVKQDDLQATESRILSAITELKEDIRNKVDKN